MDVDVRVCMKVENTINAQIKFHLRKFISWYHDVLFHYFASYKFFDFYNYMWTKFQLHLKGFLQRVLAMTGFLHVHCIWTTISQNFSKYVFTPIECNKVFFCIFVQKIAGNNKSFIAPASKSRVLLMYVIFTDRVCQLCVHYPRELNNEQSLAVHDHMCNIFEEENNYSLQTPMAFTSCVIIFCWIIFHPWKAV